MNTCMFAPLHLSQQRGNDVQSFAQFKYKKTLRTIMLLNSRSFSFVSTKTIKVYIFGAKFLMGCWLQL